MSQHPSVDQSSSLSVPTEPVSAEAAATYPGGADDSVTAQILEADHSSTASDGSTSGGGSSSGSTVGAAKEQGQQLGQQAVEGGQKVASVAADQAKSVASEAAVQAKDLMAEARSQLTDQAATQQGNVATWLHSLADELHSLTDRSAQSRSNLSTSDDRPAAATAGVVTDFASRTSGQVKGAADWLEKHDPADLLDEATRFARQRPGTFLAVAAVAGLVAGRLTRGLRADSDGSADDSGPSARPVGDVSGSAATPTGDAVVDISPASDVTGSSAVVGALGYAAPADSQGTPASSNATTASTTGPLDISAGSASVDPGFNGFTGLQETTTEEAWAADSEGDLTSDVLDDPAYGDPLRAGEDRR